ncbi:HD domain-containing protein [Indiicoccus explosivorum]|uniref:HD domain-containing protein n=1 Tax=Indiicoccus explosivorum TaxID=1917864 RepID=UPI000B432D97|nr:HD domain-containing protein [Indiicoccus explosivorum]
MSTLTEKALIFAAIKHEGHYRKGTNIPYIVHPIGVAWLLRDAGMPEEVVAAGLLHDTVEDTSATEAEIDEQFGEEVLQLVKAASEPDKSLPWEERKQHTIDGISTRAVNEAVLITADKLHNVRSIQQDADVMGEEAWLRFNRGKREQTWYYMSLVRELERRKDEIPLAKELRSAVCQLFIGKPRLKTADILLLIRYAHDGEAMQQELAETELLPFANEVRQGIAIRPDSPTVASLKERLGTDGEADEADAFYLAELQYRLALPDREFSEYVETSFLA